METLEDYLDALASASPTPGGGSAAAVAGAAAGALVAMVARITAANPKYAERSAAARDLAERADALRAALLAARQTDEEAYGRVVAAAALPRTSEQAKAARSAGLQAALAAAAAAPLHAAELARDVLRLSEAALALENPHLASDVGCAASLSAASLEASAYNVRVNHRYLRDPALVERQELALRELEGEGRAAAERVRRALAPLGSA
ncbi:MAG: cyclodeaminase/cyclohydrolase family protein [Candidatus Baltobacteraceae bacterium]